MRKKNTRQGQSDRSRSDSDSSEESIPYVIPARRDSANEQVRHIQTSSFDGGIHSEFLTSATVI